MGRSRCASCMQTHLTCDCRPAIEAMEPRQMMSVNAPQLDLSVAPVAWVATDVAGPLASPSGASGPGAVAPRVVAALPVDTGIDPVRQCPGVDVAFCLSRYRLLQNSGSTVTPSTTATPPVFGPNRFANPLVPLSDLGASLSSTTRSAYLP